jgi:hypothetical protein
MSDNAIITIMLFLAGVVPFTLAGGWGSAGDHSILPWSVGFLTQAGVVFGYIAQRRGWWDGESFGHSRYAENFRPNGHGHNADGVGR